MIAVLFDMDGTLLDLEVEIERVRDELRQLFGALGYDGGFTPILPSIDRAAGRVAHSEEQREELVRRGRGLIDEAEVRAAETARARAGAHETLRRLELARVRFGLITDNGRACVSVALRSAGLDGAPWAEDAIVTRDETPPKPSPQGVAQCARRLLPSGGELWYVGDSVRDIEAARAAGATLAPGGPGAAHTDIVATAVLGGHGRAEELRAAEPDFLVGQLSELWSLEPWRSR